MSGQAEAGAGDDGPGLGSVWPWLVFPLLPLLAALGLLKLLYGRGFTFATPGPGNYCTSAAPGGFAASFVETATGSYIAFEGFTVYAAVSLLHASLCLFAILYFAAQLLELPAPVAKRALKLIGLLLIVLVVAGVIARLDASALQLAYRNTCELLCKADVAPHIVPRNCRGGAASPLLWLASIPTLTGLLTAVLAAALASGAARPLPTSSEEAWRAAYAARARNLQRAFYLASAVLVTSTVTIMLFLQLPVALAADEATKTAVTSYASGLTVFWGTVFTLTLVAIFAPSAVYLLRAADRHEQGAADPADLRAWLTQQIFVSIPKQLGNIVAFLAPLLVGPVGTLLEKLASVT